MLYTCQRHIDVHREEQETWGQNFLSEFKVR